MTHQPWLGVGDDGVADIIPCQHMKDIDDLVTQTLARIALMIAEHGPDHPPLTVDHSVTATVSGQAYPLAVTWSIQTARKDNTDSDQHQPV